MKSKELLQEHLKWLYTYLETAKKGNVITHIEKIEEEIDKCNQVLKDLEVLEIIKKWSFLDTFYREDTDTTYEAFICNIHTKGMKEDYEKVMRWLNNEDENEDEDDEFYSTGW